MLLWLLESGNRHLKKQTLQTLNINKYLPSFTITSNHRGYVSLGWRTKNLVEKACERKPGTWRLKDVGVYQVGRV